MFSRPLAWLLIVATWIATPFINDRIPTWADWGYTALLIIAVIYGVVTAIKHKAWILLGGSILTAFAWPLLLFFALRVGGI